MRWKIAAVAALVAASTVARPKADGPPDLQGVWTSGTLTPLERPVALGTKSTYTPEEAREFERATAERRANPSRQAGDVGNDNEAFVDSDYTLLPTRQTSLIVDPPDGRLPLQPDALKKRDSRLNARDDFETMSEWDRCISRGPLLMLPASYNNGIRIVQSPGHVVIELETIHEARIIPLDGRPHIPASVLSWTGDSRGHWEGATLVVDTTNFIDSGWVATHAVAGRLRGIPNSPKLHVVERFTLISPDSLEWKMTVEDPEAYTAPWTVSTRFQRNPDYRMYEYACHEGNQAVELVLRGARAEEREGRAPK